MLTKVSSKGQMVIPAAIREMARIRTGDELDVGFSGGMVVLRKRRALSKTEINKLLREGRRLPEAADDIPEEVESALHKVRQRTGRV